MINLSYCCINLTLQKKFGYTTNRTMRKATFEEKGVPYASSLAKQNVYDLLKILEWNVANNIKGFRITSNLFPWASEYSLVDLPDWEEISRTLKSCGDLAKERNLRLSAHPGEFVKLASTKENVVLSSIKDLEIHSEIFDVMGLEASHWNPLNIHVGMKYSEETSKRFVEAFSRLSENLQKRLVVENDDKGSSYSVLKLYQDIYQEINTPITFDYFHHDFHDDGWSTEEAFLLAYSTWGTTPLFHYSESKALHEGINVNPRAHSDYLRILPEDFGFDIYLDLEAKQKELALLLLENKHVSNI